MITDLTPVQRAFYIDGFLSALRSYRRMTIAGWIVALAGVLFIPLGWPDRTGHTLLDILLSCCTIVAGVMMVEQSVGMLGRYVSIACPDTPSQETEPEELRTVRGIMKEVELGGWQEAFAAIARVEAMAKQEHGAGHID